MTGAASTTTSCLHWSTSMGTDSECRRSFSPYARHGYIDHRILSFDAYAKFIEDVFLSGQRLDPATDGRWDPRPTVRELVPVLGDLRNDFDFSQAPRHRLYCRLRPRPRHSQRSRRAPTTHTAPRHRTDCCALPAQGVRWAPNAEAPRVDAGRGRSRSLKAVRSRSLVTLRYWIGVIGGCATSRWNSGRL